MLHSSANYPVLCSDPDGKDIQNRGSMCIHITDSFCCTEEHYIVKQIYSSKILIEEKKDVFKNPRNHPARPTEWNLPITADSQ